LGKSGDKSNLLASDLELLELGATFVHIDRGGDITFHGPGQLVVYPILDLDVIFTDVGKYLRTLESSVIETCNEWQVETDRFSGRTGVWVKPDSRGAERKICAMGIRASRWVTMHGLALNVNTDLSYFNQIIPCGIADRGVTSIEQEIGQAVDYAAVQTVLIDSICTNFDLSMIHLNSDDSIDFLKDFAQVDEHMITELTAF
jgi:lipoyl(octanoyl) transferase